MESDPVFQGPLFGRDETRGDGVAEIDSREGLGRCFHREVRSDGTGGSPTIKAAVSLSWLGDNGQLVPAPGAQLILYPAYPEVRLSGFLRGCSVAPSEAMRPIPATNRRYKTAAPGIWCTKKWDLATMI